MIDSAFVNLNQATHSTVGGEAYGSLYRPTDHGSQGGVGDNGLLGGKGGGTAKITVGAIFQLDGRLEVDGEDGKDNGGGGSGGSVWIRTGQFMSVSGNA